MSKKSLKRKILEHIIDNPGVLRSDILRKFKSVLVHAELDDLFFKDKAYALSSDGGCFPSLNASNMLNAM